MDRIETFRQYLAKHPNDRFAMYSLALELKRARRFEEAVEAFRALLAVHPDSGAGHYQFGELYREEGLDDEAIATWKAGLAALEGLTSEDARRSRVEIEAALDLLE